LNFIEIYAKLQRNLIFEVAPVELHFAGFQIPTSNNKKDVKRFTQRLKIINISGEVQQMTILPPKSEFFEIYYVKPVRYLINTNNKNTFDYNFISI
jgi:hypothetical protein